LSRYLKIVAAVNLNGKSMNGNNLKKDNRMTLDKINKINIIRKNFLLLIF